MDDGSVPPTKLNDHMTCVVDDSVPPNRQPYQRVHLGPGDDAEHLAVRGRTLRYASYIHTYGVRLQVNEAILKTKATPFLKAPYTAC